MRGDAYAKLVRNKMVDINFNKMVSFVEGLGKQKKVGEVKVKEENKAIVTTEIKKCSDCGGSTSDLNICDRTECLAIDNCEFNPYLSGIDFGTCSEKKIVSENKIKDFLTNVNNQYSNFFIEASNTYNVPISLIKAIIYQESGGNPNAQGDGRKAIGLMQIKREALVDVKTNYCGSSRPCNDIINKINLNDFKNELKDPEKNINVGTAYYSLMQNVYLKDKLNKFSEDDKIKYSLLAYNFGVGNIQNKCIDTNDALISFKKCESKAGNNKIGRASCRERV